MRILAATDFSTRSNRALRQAGLLAQRADAQLYIAHVVDDDRPEEFIRSEKREAERLLSEQTNSMPELKNIQPHAKVVVGDPFDGILKVAAEVNADLVVMGSHRKQLLDVIVGTTLERVLRKGSYPVLMVNNEAQRTYENVLAPVDIVEASIRAVEVAAKLGLIDDRPPTLLHAFTPIAKGKLSLSGADQASIASYVANERQEVLNELVGFFADTLARLPGRPSLRVDEGEAIELISRAV